MYVNTVNRHENEIYFLRILHRITEAEKNGSHVFLCFFYLQCFYRLTL
nr:MAG TPA: hypothetical protein [Caudoviricetes sp.]